MASRAKNNSSLFIIGSCTVSNMILHYKVIYKASQKCLLMQIYLQSV